MTAGTISIDQRVLLGWIGGTIAIVLATCATYAYWFAHVNGGQLSSSPYVWAQFGVYLCCISAALLLSVAVGCFGWFCLHRRDLELADFVTGHVLSAIQEAVQSGRVSSEMVAALTALRRDIPRGTTFEVMWDVIELRARLVLSPVEWSLIEKAVRRLGRY